VLLDGSFLWDQVMWAPQHINGLVMMDTYHGVEPEPPRQYYFSLLQQIEEAGAIAPQLLDIAVPMGRITFSREDFMARLGELDGASTLVVCGDQDIPRPPEGAREMTGLIGCPWLLVPEAGHISNLENPKLVTETLLALLAEQISRNA
jgi:pimeloyl-ACP methyl ester carboxylesterase